MALQSLLYRQETPVMQQPTAAGAGRQELQHQAAAGPRAHAYQMNTVQPAFGALAT